MKHTLDIGSHIWFVADIKEGRVTAVEEHDWREGGWCGPAKGKTEEQLFIDTVMHRGGSKDAAVLFLKAHGVNTPETV